MKKAFSLVVIAMMGVLAFGQQTPLMDTEVASVAVVANQIDIDYAQIALEKSNNKEILDFANRMVKVDKPGKVTHLRRMKLTRVNELPRFDLSLG